MRSASCGHGRRTIGCIPHDDHASASNCIEHIALGQTRCEDAYRRRVDWFRTAMPVARADRRDMTSCLRWLMVNWPTPLPISTGTY